MSEEEQNKLNKILYYSDIHPADTDFINNIIFNLCQERNVTNSILTELEEWFKKEKQIAEQNIIESKKWLEIEEQKLVAKSDIHTGKIIRRYMQYGLNKIQELKEKYNGQ